MHKRVSFNKYMSAGFSNLPKRHYKLGAQGIRRRIPKSYWYSEHPLRASATTTAKLVEAQRRHLAFGQRYAQQLDPQMRRRRRRRRPPGISPAQQRRRRPIGPQRGYLRTGGYYGRFAQSGQEMKFFDLAIDDAVITTAGQIFDTVLPNATVGDKLAN